MACMITSAGGALQGEAAVPGDKSLSHRALILGAIAEGETTIRNLNDGEDVGRTIAALGQFGVAVEQLGDVDWRVTGSPWTSPAEPIDCGNSATTARLLIGAVAGMEGVVATFTGDPSLRTRPMEQLAVPLARMGAALEPANRLPLTVTGARPGGIVQRNDPPSAQVKSAILFAALGSNSPVEIVEPIPSRDHSEILLAQMGCAISVDWSGGGHTIRLGQQRRLAGSEIAIGGDPSAAAFPLLAGAIVPGSAVRVAGMNVSSLRTGFLDELERMGARVEITNERTESGETVADVAIGAARLAPCMVPADRVPSMIDEIPALAVACAFADGTSVIEGLGELRHKESDRLSAIAAGLNACGVMALADGDALRIRGRGRVPGDSTVMARGDHRIAMAFLVLGLAAEGPVTIDDGTMIATSFPGFAMAMRGIGADIR
jgi:3-phosphoshikimate 1-carboxyvinyltransferase